MPYWIYLSTWSKWINHDWYTLPKKTKMAPGRRPSQKETDLPTPVFQLLLLDSGIHYFLCGNPMGSRNFETCSHLMTSSFCVTLVDFPSNSQQWHFYEKDMPSWQHTNAVWTSHHQINATCVSFFSIPKTKSPKKMIAWSASFQFMLIGSTRRSRNKSKPMAQNTTVDGTIRLL